MKKYFVILAILLTTWVFFQHPKAHWQGQLAPTDPVKTSDDLPSPWPYKDFTITARAKYHIKAVIISKHHYWGAEIEDNLSSFDLALGWGAMSDAAIINQLEISQDGRWYNYHWNNSPPLAPSEIISHSSNNHIIAANQEVLDAVGHFKRYDVVDLKGYLVDVQSNKKDWNWHTSVSQYDSGGGACKLFWVTSAFTV